MGNLASAVDQLFAVDPRDVAAPHRQQQNEEILRQRNRLDAAYLRVLEAEDRSGAAVE